MSPCYRNQITEAQHLLQKEGRKELQRHAAIGTICGCRDCFCCAASHVLYAHDLREAQIRNEKRKQLT